MNWGLVGRGRRLCEKVKAARKCSVAGCPGRYRAKGLCSTHYNRQMAGIPSTIPVERKRGTRKCELDGCDRPYWSRGMCRSHYQRAARREKKNGKWVPGKKPRHADLAVTAECKSEYCRHPAEAPGGYCSICDHMVKMGIPLDYRPGTSRK